MSELIRVVRAITQMAGCIVIVANVVSLAANAVRAMKRRRLLKRIAAEDQIATPGCILTIREREDPPGRRSWPL